MRAYLIAIGLLLAIFGSIAVTLYLKFSALANADFSPPPVTVAATEAVHDSWASYLDAVGTIRAARGVELTSETSGEITELNFNSGDQVEAGQLLVVLNDKVEQASRQNQIASLELAEILYQRDSELVRKNSVSQTQYDQSKADLERARAQLAETEARLRNKRIHAPFAGSIGIRRVEMGDYISPGTIIATLQDLSELEIDFTVPARFAPQLDTGLNVEVSVNAFPEQTFKAVIQALDARVDPATRNLLLRARFLDTEGLLPGMFATLRVDLDLSTSVIVVPETAVTYSLQGNIIYVAETRPGEDGEPDTLTAVSRVVEVGEVREGKVAIMSGISAGDQVITVGQNKLYRGVSIVLDEDVDL